MLRHINVGDFSPVLKNTYPGENPGKGVQFRLKYLDHLVIDGQWQDTAEPVILDFSNVELLSPHFACDAFAFFLQYTKAENILEKIRFIHTNPVDMAIIHFELGQ